MSTRDVSNGAGIEALGAITHESILGKVMEALHRAIWSGQLAPGTRLVERELADTLGVSRAPLREALRLLERDGLVEMAPRRGVWVRVLSPVDVRELYELRAALEGLAVELVVERATDAQLDELHQLLDRTAVSAATGAEPQQPIESDWDFHRQLVRLAGSRRLMSAWESIGGEIRLALVRSTPELFSTDYIDKTHGALLRALRARDGEAAREAVVHLREIGVVLAAQWADDAATEALPVAAADGPPGRGSMSG